ncbi:MAG: glycosyltransferase, partial [Acidobacteriota bacterium]
MNLPVNLLIAILVLAGSVILSRWVPRHPRWRPLVIALNLGVTIRYLWWRGSETLNWESPGGIAVSFIVYGAEIYGFLVVLHHYLISTCSIPRTALPPDRDFLPSVDVLITTYDEAAEILYRTIVGCKAMDYIPKTIHVLDDGCREEIAELCRKLDVNYIAREESSGAKAGNLNHGLAGTAAELVVTFDADHVPVRTFLTETVGFFRDQK